MFPNKKGVLTIFNRFEEIYESCEKLRLRKVIINASQYTPSPHFCDQEMVLPQSEYGKGPMNHLTSIKLTVEKLTPAEQSHARKELI